MANGRNVSIVAVCALLLAQPNAFGDQEAGGDDPQKQNQQNQQAASQNRTAEAAVRFERGVQFFKDSNYSAALAEFEAAYQIKPNYAVLWNIAAAQKNLFRYSDALKTLERYLAEGGDSVSKQKRQSAEREQASIRALMAELIVTGPEGATLVVDEREVGRLPLGGPLWLGPGQHKLQVSQEGFKTRDVQVSVVSGDKKEVDVKLEPLPKTPTTSTLSVNSTPKGATISVDNRKVGLTPWSGTLKPGGYRVRAALTGFDTEEQEIVLTPGQERPVRFDLEKTIEPTPFFKRWYVWATIGALAVAGTGAYFVLSQEEPDVTIMFPQ